MFEGNPDLPTRARQALLADSLLVEQHENYVKQSYRNRCHVLTAHGMQPLVVKSYLVHHQADERCVRLKAMAQ